MEEIGAVAAGDCTQVDRGGKAQFRAAVILRPQAGILVEISMATTALQKLYKKKEPKKILMEKDFAGIKKGQMMLVATPQIVADYIRKIPSGKSKTIVQMRGELARRRRCDAACPVSTAIFARIAAEAAIEEMEAGKTVDEIIPFWRLISSQDKIAKKLSIDPQWIDHQRELETHS